MESNRGELVLLEASQYIQGYIGTTGGIAMPHYGLELHSNTPCDHKSATRIGYTYLRAGRRQVRRPLAVVLGTVDPDLTKPEEVVGNVQRKLPEEARDKILAVALFKDCDKHPIKTLSRLGGIAVATPNRFITEVMNPLASEVDQWGVGSLKIRDPKSPPESPHILPGSAPLRPAIILPVFATPRERHPVTDAIEVDHSIFVGLHGVSGSNGQSQYMETIVDRSMLGRAG